SASRVSRSSIIALRKAGPHLKSRPRLPVRACGRARAAVMVVLPWPDAGAAISNAGQLRLFIAASQGESSHGGCKERHPPTFPRSGVGWMTLHPSTDNAGGG